MSEEIETEEVDETGVLAVKPSEVYRNDAFNVRQKYDPAKLAGLKSTLKKQGLLSPVLVREPFEGEELPRGKHYVLIAGFRRHRAITELHKEGHEVTLLAKVVDVDELGAVQVNLIENIHRANFTSYEMAVGFKRLRDDHGMSGAGISALTRGDQVDNADKKGKSKQNVNNLIRLLDNLDPRIIEAWADETHVQHDKASTYNLFQVCGKGDHEAQWAAWQALFGLDPDGNSLDEEEGDGGGSGSSGDGESSEPKLRCRPASDVLMAVAAINEAKKAGNVEDHDAEVIKMTLRWVLKKRATLSGVKVE